MVMMMMQELWRIDAVCRDSVFLNSYVTNVLGMKFGYICALEQGWKLHVQPIVRDENLQERMKDTAQMFWENHIEPHTPPE